MAGIFDDSFASTLGRSKTKHGKWDYVNPFASNFMPYRVGGDLMETTEGILRMAAFSKYYDPDYPMLSSRLGHTMANMVHFDYNATSEWDDKIKAFMPFWTWTKNNVPLQFRMLMTQPRWINMYEKSRRAWNEGQRDEDDPYWNFKASNGWVMPFDRNDETGWAQAIWNPDLPMMDILELPLFAGRQDLSVASVQPGLSSDAVNPVLWSKMATQMMGPLISLPADIYDKERETSELGAKGRIAPVGINALANVFNVGSETPQGDRRLPAFTSNLVTTLFPFYMEYADMLGIPANSPYRKANQGFLPSEVEQAEEGLDQVGRSAQVVGSRIASGFGLKWYTPKDVFFELREIETFVENMDFARRVGQSPPSGG